MTKNKFQCLLCGDIQGDPKSEDTLYAEAWVEQYVFFAQNRCFKDVSSQKQASLLGHLVSVAVMQGRVRAVAGCLAENDNALVLLTVVFSVRDVFRP